MTPREGRAGGQPAPALTLVLWVAVILLVTVGVVAAVGRATFPGDLTIRAEPSRLELMRALERGDPLLAERPAELERIDRRFRRYSFMTVLHVVAGGLFLVLATLQFSARIRSRHLTLHRWSGRLLALMAIPTALSGLFFGVLMPYGGWVEAAAIALFGGLFLVALGKAIVAIRRGQVARHREWMIRAFAVGIGISTVRVVGAAVDITLTPAGMGPRVLFVFSVLDGMAAHRGRGGALDCLHASEGLVRT